MWEAQHFYKWYFDCKTNYCSCLCPAMWVDQWLFGSRYTWQIAKICRVCMANIISPEFQCRNTLEEWIENTIMQSYLSKCMIFLIMLQRFIPFFILKFEYILHATVQSWCSTFNYHQALFIILLDRLQLDN